MVRVSPRAHELAERIDPDGNRGRGIEYALELAALIEWRGQSREIGTGPETKHADAVLRAYLETRRDYTLIRLSQAIEILAYSAGARWPDGQDGLRGLASWMESDLEPGSEAERFQALARGDDVLRVLSRAVGHTKAAPVRDADERPAGLGNP